jgi:hypothetical protein
MTACNWHAQKTTDDIGDKLLDSIEAHLLVSNVHVAGPSPRALITDAQVLQ